MLDFEQRSNEPELMDDPSVDSEELNLALRDLARVNILLGGNHITIRAVFEQLAKLNRVEPMVIVDFGCGDGEILRKIAIIARKKKKKLKLIGLDVNEKCLQQARNLSTSYPEINYMNIDFFALQKETCNYDILLSTLTIHHLRNKEIERFFEKASEIVSEAIIINDLHRSKVAYYLFKIFSFCCLRSYIARHDGLISIQRGFRRNELVGFIRNINFDRHTIRWKWAFRYCLIIHTN